jgi:AmiR/NasT family two-component response regulator
MMAELHAVAVSVRVAVDIGKAAKAVSGFNNVNMKFMPVMAAAITEMKKQGQLNARVEELEEELARVKAWDSFGGNCR